MTTAPCTAREDERRRWLERRLGHGRFTVARASEDASFRSYWRVDADGATRILMDAPRDRDEIVTWLDIGTRLHAAGVHVPVVDASDVDAGFVLMEDLGARTYLPELDEATADGLYGDALDALATMQSRVDTAGIAPYDRVRVVDELELMPTWFLQRHLGYVPECEEWDVVEGAFDLLANAFMQAPRGFVHRDFHSRNLLVTTARNPGVIDFQGALVGPVTYDLVSLLRDCYIAWPEARIEAWREQHRLRLVDAGVIGAAIDSAAFARAFDLVGLQRHIKVLGIFCRLCYRDGKSGYLADLPLVWRYTIDVARRYPELHGFVDLLERVRGDRDLTVAREDATP
ncbi:aminoglycoside phosphotransferase family protein [Dokdonella sp. MW10]|uniref:aminoglycoside phosphotransferase family protein n=1 Tax=Dokdonella sp. MW10 TaxID=2992926 RepID=UPI003F7E4244